MISEAVLDAMLAAGCTAEQIVAAVKADAADADSRRAAKRVGNAERQRRFRNARNASSRVTGVTNGDAPPSPSSPHTPQHPLTPNSDADASESAIGFDEVRAAYPKREGDDPAKPARQAYERALKRGATPAGLLLAAKAYASANSERTRFIPRMSTWLNEDRWKPEQQAKSSEIPIAGVIPSTFVGADDPRFPALSQLQEAETGKPAIPYQGREGYGRWFPTELVKSLNSRAVAAA